MHGGKCVTVLNGQIELRSSGVGIPLVVQVAGVLGSCPISLHVRPDQLVRDKKQEYDAGGYQQLANGSSNDAKARYPTTAAFHSHSLNHQGLGQQCSRCGLGMLQLQWAFIANQRHRLFRVDGVAKTNEVDVLLVHRDSR